MRGDYGRININNLRGNIYARDRINGCTAAHSAGSYRGYHYHQAQKPLAQEIPTQEKGKMSSCKNCPDRYIGCHQHCETYKAFKAEKDRVRENEKQFKQNLYAIHKLRIDGVEKARRKRQVNHIKYK